MIFPIVMHTDFRRIACIDDYISFIWTSRFYTAGDFELCVNADNSNCRLLTKGRYIARDDDENIGIIEKIKIQRREDGSEILIVSGRFLAGILARRIVAVQTVVSGRAGKCMEKLVEDAIVNPSISARSISNFIINTHSVGDNMKAQFTGTNLMEALTKIGQTYGLGYKVTLDGNNNFVFRVYQGTNRTYDQTVRPWVVFSDVYDNLLSSEYEENYQNICTAVLVAGEGEGLDRKTVWVTDSGSHLNRYEVYSDQRNIRSDEGEITPEEYTALLTESGKESLTKYTTAFTGTVYFDNIRYKTDVKLGDICVIENSRWNISINSRLVEVIESVSETGEYKILPTFGT